MRKTTLVIFVIATLLMSALPCLSRTVSADDFPLEKQLWLRVSLQGRIWFHVGPHNNRNQPKLLPHAGTIRTFKDYKPNIAALRDLLMLLHDSNDDMITLILCDPGSDYRLVDSIFSAIDQTAFSFDTVMAMGLDVPVEELPEEAKYDYAYAFVEWLSVDRRLHQTLPETLGLPKTPAKTVDEADTFQQRLESGYWLERQEKALDWERRVVEKSFWRK